MNLDSIAAPPLPGEDHIERRGARPVSRRCADGGWSSGDRLAEARFTSLQCADLPGRLEGAAGVRIGEPGFGAGLDRLAAWSLRRKRAARGEAGFAVERRRGRGRRRRMTGGRLGEAFA